VQIFWQRYAVTPSWFLFSVLRSLFHFKINNFLIYCILQKSVVICAYENVPMQKIVHCQWSCDKDDWTSTTSKHKKDICDRISYNPASKHTKSNFINGLLIGQTVIASVCTALVTAAFCQIRRNYAFECVIVAQNGHSPFSLSFHLWSDWPKIITAWVNIFPVIPTLSLPLCSLLHVSN